MSRPKAARKNRSPTGTRFPSGSDTRLGADGFARAISDALHREYGETRGAIKVVAGRTTANERAVKNWFDGTNGPSGAFLVALCRHSDHVLETVLILSGRPELVTAKKFADAKSTLRKMLTLLDRMDEDPIRPAD